ANMGSWRWYASSKLMIWSDGLYKIWGARVGSFQPTWDSFLENVYVDDQKSVTSFIDTIRSGRGSAELNFRIDMHGNLRYIWMVTNPREEAGPEGFDILGTVMDITSQ